ncbi:hypothetical protein [Pseudomonas sp. MRSN 12121]|uniref:hypothetical protein n=1 Tax=Pseudomonas sp. MRSN 12121 TaxID=1611770 RepID=UPI0005BECA59|nr:hypothetical protein [Pseudomonas sp. MRSN 12121]AJO79365.1 hypothetical protein TO66_19600 [Pseudomonas sp. MRSN 12121]
MSKAQKDATARYRAAQIQIQALINPQTEPELAAAWNRLLEAHGNSKKKALAFAILNAPAP